MTRPLRLATGLVAVLITGACATPPATLPPVPASPGIEAPAEVHLGRVLPGSTARGVIPVRAMRAVRLVAVETTCECTTSDVVLPKDLVPGIGLDIPVSLDLAKVGNGGLPKDGSGPGSVRREVVLRTDDGEVRTSVMVEVSDMARLEPASLRLGSSPLGRAIRGSVQVLPGRGAREIHVTSVETADSRLSAVVVPDGPVQRIDVTWRPEALGSHAATILLALDRPEDPLVRLDVSAEVVAPVSVRPERIENLQAALARPVVTRIAVNRLDGQTLDLLGAESDNHRVLVELVPGSGREREVQVIIPVMLPPAESAGIVTIRTGVPGAERLVVPFRVRAASPG